VPIRIDTVSNVLVSKSNDISCNTPFAQLSTNVSGISYQWSPSGSLSNATVANPVATPAVNTTYTVSITGINGCKSTGSVEVKALNNNDFRLYQMANSFTPNSDGLNDCFGITKWGSVNIINFLVFNRWGQVVFAGNNSNPCWDGNFKGMPQQAGNFVYKLTAQTNCGVIERKGNVVLIR
jgi:gliding motility-associated-like protein